VQKICYIIDLQSDMLWFYSVIITDHLNPSGILQKHYIVIVRIQI